MTLATAFAETTRRLANPAELRTRTLALYRKFIRHSPDFVNMYLLHFPPLVVRTKIRAQFERHRFVEDLAMRNVLYAKAQMEYQETMNFWKQKSHVMTYFAEQEDYGFAQDNGFVGKFLRGQ